MQHLRRYWWLFNCKIQLSLSRENECVFVVANEMHSSYVMRQTAIFMRDLSRLSHDYICSAVYFCRFGLVASSLHGRPIIIFSQRSNRPEKMSKMWPVFIEKQNFTKPVQQTSLWRSWEFVAQRAWHAWREEKEKISPRVSRALHGKLLGFHVLHDKIV